MDLATITAIRLELERELSGQKFGKIFQLSKHDFAFDFRLPASRYLFVSVEPGNPRVYLVNRRLRDLEKASVNPTSFAQLLRKRLSSARLSSITQIPDERVLLALFEGLDDLEAPVAYTLAIQLTGVSANLFLLDLASRILDTVRQTHGEGQQVGDVYSPPEKRSGEAVALAIELPAGTTLSEKLDEEDVERSRLKRFQSLAGNARSKLKQELSKRRKLVQRLTEDLEGHGDADRWKRLGDLLLANVGSARRDGDKVWVNDYFDEASPEVGIDIDENDSVIEAAEKFFKRYTKARNAGREIVNRMRVINAELATLEAKAERLEGVIASGDEDLLLDLAGIPETRSELKAARKRKETPSGSRTFLSSDGFEILVGKKSTDNDYLTFRVAKSLDTWMHAADYPGSHVVIRNPNRNEIPPKTLVEAAQLAAFYSQGKAQPKAAVHYTQKKFVNKPKGAAPGLVSLASFKTLLVEPKIGEVTLQVE